MINPDTSLQLLSAAQDRTLRLWDYNARVCAGFAGLPSKAVSVAFHPSGKGVCCRRCCCCCCRCCCRCRC